MRIVCVLLMSILPFLGWAAIDAHTFNDPSDEERFRVLINELRCPKCQNQNISDSNAPLAADLRQKVAGMILDDKSDNEIVDYMVQRYGDFVTYRPPFDARTWLLWFGPFTIVAVAGLTLVIWIRRRGREQQTTNLSADERARLNELLQNNTQDN